MKIKMLETVRGSLDGINAELFLKGSEHDLPDNAAGDDLARNLITGRLAEEVKAKPEKKAAADSDAKGEKAKPDKKADEA
jgi:hypothetical protein